MTIAVDVKIDVTKIKYISTIFFELNKYYAGSWQIICNEL